MRCAAAFSRREWRGKAARGCNRILVRWRREHECERDLGRTGGIASPILLISRTHRRDHGRCFRRVGRSWRRSISLRSACRDHGNGSSRASSSALAVGSPGSTDSGRALATDPAPDSSPPGTRQRHSVLGGQPHTLVAQFIKVAALARRTSPRRRSGGSRLALASFEARWRSPKNPDRRVHRYSARGARDARLGTPTAGLLAAPPNLHGRCGDSRAHVLPHVRGRRPTRRCS